METSTTPQRQDPRRPRRVVVKLGSATLRQLDFDALARELCALRNEGLELALVTSGAVAFGMAALNVAERPDKLSDIQALAALGQVDLMARYRAAFAAYRMTCGQVLLTHEALSDRRHFLNIRHALHGLLARDVIPIANENDTVATEELRFGDNDRLAAAFATVIDADLVILLSDIDALYDADPRQNPDATPIREVSVIDDTLLAVAGSAGSNVGTGGMAPKLAAARVAMDAGIPLVLTSGHDPAVLRRILEGEPVGTRFVPSVDRMDRRRHWIGYLSKLQGSIVVDDGACKALTDRGSSLLPIGVTSVTGPFVRGDAIAVLRADGTELGRGLVSYDSETLIRVQGLRSADVRAHVGQDTPDAVIHRNDLVFTTHSTRPE